MGWVILKIIEFYKTVLAQNTEIVLTKGSMDSNFKAIDYFHAQKSPVDQEDTLESACPTAAANKREGDRQGCRPHSPWQLFTELNWWVFFQHVVPSVCHTGMHKGCSQTADFILNVKAEDLPRKRAGEKAALKLSHAFLKHCRKWIISLFFPAV